MVLYKTFSVTATTAANAAASLTVSITNDTEATVTAVQAGNDIVITSKNFGYQDHGLYRLDKLVEVF